MAIAQTAVGWSVESGFKWIKDLGINTYPL